MNAEPRDIERAAAQWLARRDAGAWDEAEQHALDAWLAEAIAHRVAFLRIESAWEQAGRLKALATDPSRAQVPARGSWRVSPYFVRATDRPAPTAGRCDRRARGARRLPLAAAALFAILAVGGSLAWRSATHVDRGEWHTALGASRVVRLVDGSTATLGSDSALHAALSRRGRELYLPRGEAFFDVAHDAARPFVVHADGYRVTAVGTRFDVRRGDAGRLRVVVTHGLVKLQSDADPAGPPTMLPAGSIAMVRRGALAVQQVTPDAARERLRWRDGYAVFHSTPLAEAAEEFNRYNARKIVLADASLGALRVGGNFRLDNSVGFVRLMQEIFPVDAEFHDSDIVLRRRAAPRRR